MMSMIGLLHDGKYSVNNKDNSHRGFFIQGCYSNSRGRVDGRTVITGKSADAGEYRYAFYKGKGLGGANIDAEPTTGAFFFIDYSGNCLVWGEGKISILFREGGKLAVFVTLLPAVVSQVMNSFGEEGM